MKPEFSIIMPAFNAEKYIEQTIRSVIKQTYREWELIIVDDGSVDSTLDIVKKYTEKDSRIKLFKNKGKGAGAARNTGIDVARFPYVAFIDSDDLYGREFLNEAQKRILNGADCVIFDYFVFSENRNGNARRVGITPYDSFTAAWNKVYKKNLWENLRFDEHNVIEDLQVVPIVVSRAQKPIHANIDIYYYYRYNLSSLTKTESLEEARGILSAVNILISRMKTNNLSFNSDAASFINNLVVPHLIRGVKGSNSRLEKRKLYILIADYLSFINREDFKINSNFYCKNRFKRVRTKVVLFLMGKGLYNLSFKFMELSWYIGGRLRR